MLKDFDCEFGTSSEFLFLKHVKLHKFSYLHASQTWKNDIYPIQILLYSGTMFFYKAVVDNVKRNVK